MRRKILYVVTKGDFGGAQRYVFDLATRLPHEAFDVVVASGGPDALAERLRAEGIRTLRIESLARDMNPVKELRAAIELWRIMRRERPDIVHLNSPKAGGIGAFIARLVGVEHIVYTTHGWAFLEPRPLWWRALTWLASWITALLSHVVIVVSSHEARSARMPFVDRKLRIIQTAIPPIAFREREDARTTLVSEHATKRHAQDIWLVTIAELNANKNLQAALDAVAAFNAESEWKVFYTIMGGGELMGTLAAYVQDRGLEDHVQLLGYVEEARTYLKAFDIFLLPSKKEGLPYAVLEAGAARLPVIASAVGGIPEVVTHGTEGLLIDPYDPATIVAALERFSSDPTLRMRCSEALAAKVENQHSLDRMVEETRRVYEL